ncbi:3-hydroxyacyl-CoA dehydrogenase family protein [Desulfovibrio sp. OttesenSCG-928-O18]|nr:3-hydroxyacyl-CoA dehydrogenase family protein [Desulfovibrio sp. OttesenSCG-928-O18]
MTQQARKIAILGAGTMGTGLAALFASQRWQVSLYSIPDPSLDRAPSLVRNALEGLAEGGRIAMSDVPALTDMVRCTSSLEEAVAGCPMILETVLERLDVKKGVYEQLDAICPEDVIITSNTSYLDIFSVMPARRQKKTAITHFFTPPQIMPLVEVVRGTETDDATVKYLVDLYDGMGHVPVTMEKYVPGFCVNRLLRCITDQACWLVDGGYITAEELDKAAKASIIPRAMVLGIMQRYDFTGIDLSWQNIKNGTDTATPPGYKPKCVTKLAEAGDYGVKTGKGFYDYTGRTMEEVFRERDKRVMEILDVGKKYIKNPV